jgi:RNA polymerase sigma-70 factor (TIGR02943 family)
LDLACAVDRLETTISAIKVNGIAAQRDHREQRDPVNPLTRPERWLNEYGEHLYRFALTRVSRPDAAEDLVQETLLAALVGVSSFAGQSSERTWLTGILKHKVMDWLRHSRQTRSTACFSEEHECQDGLTDRSGQWKVCSREWSSDPAAILEHREFRDVFRRCLEALPDRLREVLTLRLLDEVPAAEVCQVLGISTTNLWTLLHRARVRLWHSLERAGLGNDDHPGLI